jgi:hypothetical protein
MYSNILVISYQTHCWQVEHTYAGWYTVWHTGAHTGAQAKGISVLAHAF